MFTFLRERVRGEGWKRNAYNDRGVPEEADKNPHCFETNKKRDKLEIQIYTMATFLPDLLFKWTRLYIFCPRIFEYMNLDEGAILFNGTTWRWENVELTQELITLLADKEGQIYEDIQLRPLFKGQCNYYEDLTYLRTILATFSWNFYNYAYFCLWIKPRIDV